MAEIRKLPAQAERVETGPVQFGDDWPGVFIRGDNAFGYAGALSAVVRNGEVSDPFQSMMLRSLLELLTTSDLTGISQRDAGVLVDAEAQAQSDLIRALSLDPHRGPFDRTAKILDAAGQCLKEAVKPEKNHG